MLDAFVASSSGVLPFHDCVSGTTRPDNVLGSVGSSQIVASLV